jgi:hypothetical protein
MPIPSPAFSPGDNPEADIPAGGIPVAFPLVLGDGVTEGEIVGDPVEVSVELLVILEIGVDVIEGVGVVVDESVALELGLTVGVIVGVSPLVTVDVGVSDCVGLDVEDDDDVPEALPVGENVDVAVGDSVGEGEGEEVKEDVCELLGTGDLEELGDTVGLGLYTVTNPEATLR